MSNSVSIQASKTRQGSERAVKFVFLLKLPSVFCQIRDWELSPVSVMDRSVRDIENKVADIVISLGKSPGTERKRNKILWFARSSLDTEQDSSIEIEIADGNVISY
jgi:hypothetical protein